MAYLSLCSYYLIAPEMEFAHGYCDSAFANCKNLHVLRPPARVGQKVNEGWFCQLALMGFCYMPT